MKSAVIGTSRVNRFNVSRTTAAAAIASRKRCLDGDKGLTARARHRLFPTAPQASASAKTHKISIPFQEKSSTHSSYST